MFAEKFTFFLLLSILLIPFNLQAQSEKKIVLSEIASSDMLWTGVAVSKEGRVFVNYPRWSPNTNISVAELDENGYAVPFPSQEWNTWFQDISPEDHFLCVQSVYIDKNNFLWILDTGNPFFRGVIEKGAKLIKIDLSNNQIVQTIFFDNTTALANSYLNDVRVDTKLDFAYLTDSSVGAIVTVDLKTGITNRYLSGHPSTMAEDITIKVEGVVFPNKVHSDGIALSPGGTYIYYKALTGKKLYRIKTEYLRDNLSQEEINSKVEFVKDTYATDAIMFDSKGNLFLSSIEHNAIHILDKEGNITEYIKNENLKWPDSFSITPDDNIYLTTSQLHLGFSPPQPYKIYQLIRESN